MSLFWFQGLKKSWFFLKTDFSYLIHFLNTKKVYQDSYFNSILTRSTNIKSKKKRNTIYSLFIYVICISKQIIYNSDNFKCAMDKAPTSYSR